ncbi:MAG: response regulator transcription factor [Saprospiraceae bacterium]
MHKHSLLVVEDSRSMGQFLALRFSKNYNVTLCQDPLDALKKIEQGLRPTAVITDLNMPGMNGYDLLQALRRHLPSVPVMVLSSAKESKSRIKALQSGADDFMSKPFHPEELEVRLAKMIATPAARPATVKAAAPQTNSSVWQLVPTFAKLAPAYAS